MDVPNDISRKPWHPLVPSRSILPISQSDFCEEGAELIERWRTASAPVETDESFWIGKGMNYEEDKQYARSALIKHRELCPLCMTKPYPRSFLQRIGSPVLVLLFWLLAVPILCIVYIFVVLLFGLLAVPMLCIDYIFPKRELPDFWLSDFWN